MSSGKIKVAAQIVLDFINREIARLDSGDDSSSSQVYSTIIEEYTNNTGEFDVPFKVNFDNVLQFIQDGEDEEAMDELQAVADMLEGLIND